MSGRCSRQRTSTPSSPRAFQGSGKSRAITTEGETTMKRLLLLLVTVLFSALALAAVNINTADRAELEALPEIGPVKAQAIIDYRNANGPFKSPEDVMKVSGIKEGTYGKIKGLISVSGASTPLPAAAPAPTAAPAPAAKTASPAATPPAAGAAGAASGTDTAAAKDAKMTKKEK